MGNKISSYYEYRMPFSQATWSSGNEMELDKKLPMELLHGKHLVLGLSTQISVLPKALIGMKGHNDFEVLKDDLISEIDEVVQHTKEYLQDIRKYLEMDDEEIKQEYKDSLLDFKDLVKIYKIYTETDNETETE